MAHFAELDANNIVTRVVVISNDDLKDENGNEVESLGVAVCHNIFGPKTTWVQTSYNGNFRKRYAGTGDKYEPTADLFYSPNSPYPSWTLDANYDWQPPTPKPADGKLYEWDEPTLAWVEVVLPEE
jgi:hypothetical protein